MGKTKNPTKEKRTETAIDEKTVEEMIMKSLQVCEGYIESLPDDATTETAALGAMYLLAKLTAKGYMSMDAAKYLFGDFESVVGFMKALLESEDELDKKEK